MPNSYAHIRIPVISLYKALRSSCEFIYASWALPMTVESIVSGFLFYKILDECSCAAESKDIKPPFLITWIALECVIYQN